eukprot:50613-Pleurochrysis_carterae.AAC.1
MEKIKKAQKEAAQKEKDGRENRVEKGVAQKTSSLREQRDLASAWARLAEDRLKVSNVCSAKKLKRASDAEAKVSEQPEEITALHKRNAALSAVNGAASEALSRQAAMPALHAQRAKGKTNGGKALPLAMHALAYGQLARLTPPRAIGPNI